MKRKLALLLAVVMVLSMIPMMAFATSTNTISRVLIVNDDDNLNDVSFATIPQLILEPKDDTWAATESFYLELSEDAEWNLATGGGSVVTAEDKNDVSIVGTTPPANSETYTYEKVTARRLNVTINNAVQGEKYAIPLNVDLDGAEGNVTVTVVPDGSAVSPGTYTFATVVGGDTKITIDTVNRIVEDGQINTIFIEETVRGSFVDGTTRNLRFLLPNHFEFSNANVTYEVGGGFTAVGPTPVTGTLSNGDRQISFDVPVTSAANQQRGWIKITNLDVSASVDAPEGDVILRARGDLTSEDVKALTLVGYGMEVKVKDDKDPKEIFAGRYEGAYTTTVNTAGDEAHQLARLRIREDYAGAWLPGRRTTIEFPSWVKIVAVDVKTADGLGGVAAMNTTLTPSDRGDNKIEFNVSPSARALLEVDFYVSVAADAEGDIVAKVGGSGFAGEWHEVVLGKAIAPVTLEAEVSDVRIGLKNQPIGKITITENEEGAIQSTNTKNMVQLELEPWMEWSKKPTITVDGELTIDKDSIDIIGNGRVLEFKVTGSSVDEPAVITIEGGAVDVSRSVPEGKFAVSVGGNALVNNYTSSSSNYNEGRFNKEFIAEADVVNVITPAPGETTTKEAVLTIGSTTMFVDGVAEVASAAPYIDTNNRTMLPVSAIGRALGAEVDWNAASRTVLITKDGNRVLLTIGSDTMNVNGMMIPMRSEAVITGDRTFVPVRDLGVALGVATEWDAATQTVTIK